MKKNMSLCLALLIMFSFLAAANDKKVTSAFQFKVLWDRSGGSASWSPTGEFHGLGKELQNMGAKIVDLQPMEMFSDEILDGYDIVIMFEHWQMMLGTEQQALVRYIRKGGSLLVVSDKWSAAATNPVLNNFGIMFTATQIGCSRMTCFTHPATTDRRPVKECWVDEPFKIQISGKAKSIAGRYPCGPPAADSCSQCFMALGGNSGKGRVIAAEETDLWRSGT